MSKTVDIQELSREILSQVAEMEQAKTASEKLPEELQTEIGRALKEAADKVRECDSTAVTAADISSLFKEAKCPSDDCKDCSKKSEANCSQCASHKKTASISHPSPLGNEIRKLAQTVRDQSILDSTTRTKQAAHIFNAAVGLAHLRSLS